MQKKLCGIMWLEVNVDVEIYREKRVLIIAITKKTHENYCNLIELQQI